MVEDVEFSEAQLIARKTREERQRVSALLWESLEAGSWVTLQGPSHVTLSVEQKIQLQVDHCSLTLMQFLILSSHSILLLSDVRAREILQYGAARRIESIRNAVENIIEIAPPGRKKRLTTEERRAISDSILLFYVHIIGVLDAFAIALFRKLNLGDEKQERKSDLLNKKFRSSLNVRAIEGLFASHDDWLLRIKDDLRNRYVHRIPPYVPDARFTESEATQYGSLEKKKFELLAAGDLDGVSQVEEAQESLGVFEPILTFSENNSHMLLHPTIVDDTFRFICLIFDLLEITIPIFEAE